LDVVPLVPATPTALPMMDLSPWEPTPFVQLEFALTRTFAKTTHKITAVVPKTLAETTVKRTVLARLVPLLLIVVPSMEVNPQPTYLPL